MSAYDSGAAVLLLALFLSSSVASSQESDSVKSARFQSIPWVEGPSIGTLGSEAQLTVRRGCRFAGAAGAKTFMELTENPPDSTEQGVLLCSAASGSSLPWFVIFSFASDGYVKDDERNTLDADTILAAVRRATDAANDVRRQRGWKPMTIQGWVRPPYYDSTTHNLTWTLQGVSDTSKVVNHSVRLLGRGGVMSADLVIDPSQAQTTLLSFDTVLAGYHFTPGHTYADWRQGDKLASYGLTALIAGGVGAAAMKMGFLARLWKFVVVFLAAAWKFIVAAVAGALAWVRSLFKRKTASRSHVGGKQSGP
jgi:uncharacterized membrane-anchored protein